MPPRPHRPAGGWRGAALSEPRAGPPAVCQPSACRPATTRPPLPMVRSAPTPGAAVAARPWRPAARALSSPRGRGAQRRARPTIASPDRSGLRSPGATAIGHRRPGRCRAREPRNLTHAPGAGRQGPRRGSACEAPASDREVFGPSGNRSVDRLPPAPLATGGASPAALAARRARPERRCTRRTPSQSQGQARRRRACRPWQTRS